MTNDIFYDNLLSTLRLADTGFEQSVETEILLADYDAPVFKIVKTTMDHCVTQKYITKNKLVIEGFIRLCIYYQPPAGEKLNVIGQKLPFQRQIDITADETDNCIISVTGQSQYVNTRPQNPTRIDVRGAYMFNVRVYSTTSTKIVTAAGSPTIYCDGTQLDYFALTGQNIRQFTSEDTLALPDNVQKIIGVHTAPSSPAVTVYKGKITAKGEIAANIFYTTTDSTQINRTVHTFAYNQIIDIPAVQENHIAYATAAVTAFTVGKNGDTDRFAATMTVQLEAVTFARQQVMAVCDAFSRCYCCTKDEQSVTVDKNIITADRTFAVKFNVQTGGNCTAQHIVYELSPVKSYFEINKMTVKAKLTAHIICLNGQNEYECISHTEDVVLPWLEKCSRYDEIMLSLCCDAGSFSHNGDNVSVTVNIGATGYIIEKQPVVLLQGFEENRDAPLADRQQALILYYGQKGERIFDIAKQHCVSPQEICQNNNIETQQLEKRQMLFINAFEE
ncbi:MAG: DUF3794 domain-containing protein [Oscillospiraceae bacterium]|nr:DUF3794 domain-containing protein [Oscillospiraceae bacterium]